MIALYVHQLRATGVVRNCLALAEHLAGEARAVTILTALPGGTVPNGVGHVTLARGDAPNRTTRKLEPAMALRAWTKRDRPAILVSMGNHGHATVLAAMAMLPSAPRTIFRISNDLERSAPGAPKGTIGQRVVRRLGAHIAAARADALVTVSARLANDPAFARARRAGRVHVIANGIDIDAVAAHKRPALDCYRGPEPVCLAVGRLDPQKNYAHLIEALARLQSQRRVRLIIIGSSRHAGRAEALRRHAVDHGVGGCLHIIDHSDDIFAHYANADCFVLPSWWEGSANVLLEAMAAGCPVAASRSAGNAADLIGDDRYGRLFDPADPTDIARAIAQQLDRDKRTMPHGALVGYERSETLARWSALIDRMHPA